MKTKIFYDFATTNKSFRDCYSILKSDGIINNKFMLSIYDADLISIDPYNPDLSDDIKNKIIKECKKNIWYFFREILRFPNHTQYYLYKSNCAMIFLSTLNQTMWLSNIRETFATNTSLGIILYNFIFGSPLSNLYDNIIGNTNKISIGIKDYRNDKNNLLFEKLKMCYDCLPDYIKNLVSDKLLRKSVYFNLNYSKYNESANRGCRGYGITFYNNAEFIKDIDLIYNKYLLKDSATGYDILISGYSDDYEENGAKNLLDSCIEWKDNMYDEKISDLLSIF